MERYFKRKSISQLPSSPKRSDIGTEESVPEINLIDLPADPGLRPRVLDFDPNQVWNNWEALLNGKQNIDVCFPKHTDQARNDYQICLIVSIHCIRFLVRQGIAFCGCDEYQSSSNQGNFLELLKLLSDYAQGITAVALKNALQNHKLMSPTIPRDIVNAISVEITVATFADMDNSLFSILISESQDLSSIEEMAIIVRYVDKKGCVIERFVGIENIVDTTDYSLKKAIDAFLCRNKLSVCQLRGQSYDGESNMLGQFNVLKTLILEENKYAFYIHCFVYQLHLALVDAAKNHFDILGLFKSLTKVTKVVGASTKHHDSLREKQDSIFEALHRELSSGSYYNLLLKFITMFSSIVEVLDIIAESGSYIDQKNEANILFDSIQSFDFVLCLHLMRTILGISNDLSQALQRKEQDIVNAMECLKICKERLILMRDSSWDSLLAEVCSFCNKHHIEIRCMDDVFIPFGRSRHKAQEITYLHHYRVELFYTVIDMQLQELSNRFNKTSIELLLCMACLNPKDQFSAFDKQKLIRLAQFYDKDFPEVELLKFEDQLDNYIMDLRSSLEFSSLFGIRDLAKKMIETKKDKIYPLVYLLIKLALILPVTTPTVERVFSDVNIVKNDLQEQMGDKWLNDYLVAYIEKDIIDSIGNDAIMHRYENMKTRTEQL